jgi:hypothetical protein
VPHRPRVELPARYNYTKTHKTQDYTMNNQEKEVYYMNPYTGSVDTLDGWDCDLDTLIEVELNESGDWVEVK